MNFVDPGMEELSDDAVRCSIALAAKHKDGKLLKLLLDRFKGYVRYVIMLFCYHSKSS